MICFHKWLELSKKIDGEWIYLQYCEKCGKIRTCQECGSHNIRNGDSGGNSGFNCLNCRNNHDIKIQVLSNELITGTKICKCGHSIESHFIGGCMYMGICSCKIYEERK